MREKKIFTYHRAVFLNVFLLTGILQVSGCSFRDTLELTKHAESLGVAAIGGLTTQTSSFKNHV